MIRQHAKSILLFSSTVVEHDNRKAYHMWSASFPIALNLNKSKTIYEMFLFYLLMWFICIPAKDIEKTLQLFFLRIAQFHLTTPL